MNILATTDIYTVRDVSGIYRTTFALAPRMARMGHVFDLVLPCPDDEGYLRETYPGVDFHFYRLSGSKPLKPFEMLIKGRSVFLERLRARDYDIVQVSQPMSSMGPVLLGAVKGKAVVYRFDSPWAVEYRARTSLGGAAAAVRKKIEKEIILRSGGIVVLSDYMKGLLFEEHPECKGMPVEKIPGGVETDLFHPAADVAEAKRAAGFPEDRFIIITVRGLKPRQGVDLVIKALPDVVKAHPDVLLVVCGNGPMRPELEAMVEKLGLGGHVRFEGFVEEAKLPLCYQAADMSVMPSRELEGFGLATVEALACGAPVIGTPVGGTVEILSGIDAGLLSGDVTADGIAERLMFWLGDRPALPALRAKCASLTEERYSWNTIARMYDDYYKRAALEFKR